MNPEQSLLEAAIQQVSVLFRYRLLIILMTAGVAIAVTAFCVLSIYLPPDKSPLPNKYTAYATILVHRGSENDLTLSIRSALGLESNSPEAATGFDPGAQILFVLQSRTFLDGLVEEFDVVKRYRIMEQAKSSSRRALLSRLKVDNNRSTGAVTISFTDIDPVFARDLTNRTVALLGEWYSQNMGSTKSRQKQLLEGKISEVVADIDRLESVQADLQKKYGALTAQDLSASQASAVAALRSQLILKEIDIKNYSGSRDDPKIQQLENERQTILSLIKRAQQGAPVSPDTSLGPMSLTDAQMEFNNLALELDIQRKIHTTLSHQYEVLKLTAGFESPFQVMELAEVPDAKSGPKRSRIIVEATAAAALASIVLAFFLNGVSRIRAVKEGAGISAMANRLARKKRE